MSNIELTNELNIICNEIVDSKMLDDEKFKKVVLDNVIKATSLVSDWQLEFIDKKLREIPA